MNHAFYKPFEDNLQSLLAQNGEAELFQSYLNTAACLKNTILEKIQAKEAQLTDHGPKHVTHVMQQAFKIINGYSNLTHYDVFILAYAIMFHDAGNIDGRKGHAESIHYALSTCAQGLGQSGLRIVSQIVKAHGGSSDTIQEVSETPSFQSETIKARELAAILRFADELAEGETRTSTVSMDKLVSNDESLLHHMYSMCTDIAINAESKTITAQYNICLKKISNTCYAVAKSNRDDIDFHKVEFSAFLKFISERLNKINIERKYTSNYCKIISDYKRIAYTINIDGCENECFRDELNDLILPGDNRDVPSLIDKLTAGITETFGGRCADQ